MKNINITKCLLTSILLVVGAPLLAGEILITSSDISIYDEGDASLKLGDQLLRWSAAEDASIPKSLKKNFLTYCEAKPLSEGKEILVAAKEGGWAIVNRETKKARAFGVCGKEVFSVEKILDNAIAVSCKDERSKSGCVYIVDVNNKDKIARFVFDMPRGLYWDKEKSLLWVLDAGALTGCKVVKSDDGSYSLTRTKLISLVDRGTGLGYDLSPVVGSTNNVLSVSTKDRILFFDTQKTNWLKNRTTIHVGGILSYSKDVSGKDIFVRPCKDGLSSNLLEKRKYGKLLIPFKKLEGASIRRARWIP